MGAGASNPAVVSDDFRQAMSILDKVQVRLEWRGRPYFVGVYWHSRSVEVPILKVYCTDLRMSLFETHRSHLQLARDFRSVLEMNPSSSLGARNLSWTDAFTALRLAILQQSLELSQDGTEVVLSILIRSSPLQRGSSSLGLLTVSPPQTETASAIGVTGRLNFSLALSKNRHWRRDVLPCLVDNLTSSIVPDVSPGSLVGRSNQVAMDLGPPVLDISAPSTSRTHTSTNGLLPSSASSSRTVSPLPTDRPSTVAAGATRSSSDGNATADDKQIATSSSQVSLPLEIILKNLSEVKKKVGIPGSGFTKADVERIDYIIDILENNKLYDPKFSAAKVEQIKNDKELSSWLETDLAAKKELDEHERRRLRGQALFRSVAKAMAFAKNLKKSFEETQSRVTAGLSDSLVRCLDRIDDWNFDIFEVAKLTNQKPLFLIGYVLLNRLNLGDRFGIQTSELTKLLKTVESHYLPNHYHSQVHAADVTQSFYWMMRRTESWMQLPPVQQFAAIMACIVHDLAHPGHNNNFEKNTESARAFLYNDQSILENFHLAKFFEILRSPDIKVYSCLKPEDRRTFRSTLINMVLATDMTKHFAFLGQFKSMVQRGFKIESADDVNLFLQTFIKAADISNPTKPLNLYLDWAERAMAEFFDQGDKERTAGVPISPFCDRKTTQKSKCQLGFIDFLALPLFEAVVSFDDRLKVLTENVASNKQYWKERSDL